MGPIVPGIWPSRDAEQLKLVSTCRTLERKYYELCIYVMLFYDPVGVLAGAHPQRLPSEFHHTSIPPRLARYQSYTTRDSSAISFLLSARNGIPRLLRYCSPKFPCTTTTTTTTTTTVALVCASLSLLLQSPKS